MAHFKQRAGESLNLRTAVVAFVVLPCLLVMGLASWIGLRGLEEQINARMQEDLELIARTLRLPLSEAIRQDRPGLVQAAIDSTVGFDQVYAVNVYDEKGVRVAQSGRRRAAVPSRTAAEMAEQGERLEAAAAIGTEQLVSVFQPLTTGDGRIAGLLQVTRHSGAVRGYLERTQLLALVGVATAGALLTLLIVLGHHYGVGRHARAIETGLQRVREGDDRHRLTPAGVAEFRSLASNINRMLDGIAASQQALERQRATEAGLREQLHQSEKMAAVGRLAAGVAHELGSPLAALYGRAQQLLRAAPLEAAERPALQAIQDAALRMEQTIRQLLDYGRANPLQRRRVELAPLLRRLADEALTAAADPPQLALPCPDPSLAVCADPLRLEQALRNLIDNGLDAARRKVTIGAAAGDDGSVRVYVADDGPGIPPAERDRVFEPFFTTKPVGQGTGLGLSVAAAAAADHGGRLVVTDDPLLGGARFTLQLPAEPPDDQA
ncbi:HAMP domain-containing sensor histidine kinase [Thioalkalivibrio sp. XN8]|uniref:sensor histidine kinase n=1 Tax=Thioalkalivibrio sp. XN8 TaxID=2712863 RepID=UPI0013EB3666|nr:HAMP domain-containing sensor histidine kinase [Thioalkalivibrio sp. XN8]NGP53758.1 two-component sensor histidine kinase [Thioalkalivibrio sp. XN8]